METSNEKAYWDDMSGRYDNHARKSAKMYDRMVQFIKDDVSGCSAVLDIGTGTGDIPLRICGDVGHVEGVDYSECMIAVAKEKAAARGTDNVRFQVQDCYKLSCGDESFDAVIVANLLHVVEHPAKVLAEAHRVLRPTGKLLAPTYVHNEYFRTKLLSWIVARMGHPVHHRYDSAHLSAMIERNHFDVVDRKLIQNTMPLSYVVAIKRRP